MDIQSRLDLIRQVGEEIITEEELKQLLETKSRPIAYDGFEPSGRIHIAQAVLRAININKMTKVGCHFKMWVADWFAWMNNKMDGDLGKIRIAGEYMLEVWKACDLDFKNVEFVWAKDVVTKEDHWKTTIDVARHATVKRIIKCAQIMGRKESDTLSAAQIIYPCMQVGDIFHLKCDIAQLGMDQRKVNVLAREIGPKLGFWKPVVVSHHMLMGLGKPPAGINDPAERTMEMKMSKSKPDSAIFMTDSEDDIRSKISKAYCPEKEVNENPILEYCRYIIFEKFREMNIERPAKFGGNLSFGSYKELENAFANGNLHPMDLKQATAIYIDRLVKPVRDHFEKNARAKKLLEQVKGFEVTR